MFSRRNKKKKMSLFLVEKNLYLKVYQIKFNEFSWENLRVGKLVCREKRRAGLENAKIFIFVTLGSYRCLKSILSISCIGLQSQT